MAVHKFVKTDNTGFNYRLMDGVDGSDGVALAPGEEITVRFPIVTANKRGVNDIGWQIFPPGGARVYATISDTPEEELEMWMEIRPDEGINKTSTAVKIVNDSDKPDNLGTVNPVTAKALMRVILF